MAKLADAGQDQWSAMFDLNVRTTWNLYRAAAPAIAAAGGGALCGIGSAAGLRGGAEMPGADTSRWVQPTEVAEAMAFLLSDAASGVSGALLPVGG